MARSARSGVRGHPWPGIMGRGFGSCGSMTASTACEAQRTVKSAKSAVEAFEIGLNRAWFVLDAGSDGEIDDGTRDDDFAGGGRSL